MSTLLREGQWLLHVDGRLSPFQGGTGQEPGREAPLTSSVWDAFPAVVAAEMIRGLGSGPAASLPATIEYALSLDGTTRYYEARLHDRGDGRLLDVREIAHGTSSARLARDPSGESASNEQLSTISILADVLAHQLSQPLTASLASAEAALQMVTTGWGTSADLGDALRDIITGHERLVAIVQNLRERCGSAGRPRKRVDVNEVVRGVSRTVQHDAVRKRISITVSLSRGSPVVDGSIDEIRELVAHLLTNACDAVQDCDDTRREVTVRTSVDDEEAVIH